MNRFFVLLMICQLTLSCKPDDNSGKLYVSNWSLDQFDSALVRVSVDEQVIYEDTLTNKYISHHWDEKSFPIPSDSFKVNVEITGQDFRLSKDTTLHSGKDLQQMFISFQFRPRYKRYRNPEIYLHLKAGPFDLKKFADSLYENHILKNEADYLNDTIPLSTHIDVVFKKKTRE